jgi:hypothetical protein
MTKIRIYNGQIEVEIAGKYIRAERGSRDCGVQMEPDEPAHFEDIVARLNGEVVELSESDLEIANEKLMEEI